MLRHLTLLTVFTRVSLVREMTFKANFITNILVEIGWTFVTIFSLEVMFYHTDSISGWTKGEAFFIYAFYRIMSALFAMIFSKNTRILPMLINSGELDLLLTKPVNSFFLTSTRHIAIDRLAQIGISIAILFYATSLITFRWTPTLILIVVTLSFFGSLIRFSVSAIIHSFSFWLQKLQNLERLELALFGVARFPRQAFPPLLSSFMTFIVPIVFVAAIPAEIILKKISLWFIPITIVVSLFSLIVAYKFFNFALRHYSSASS